MEWGPGPSRGPLSPVGLQHWAPAGILGLGEISVTLAKWDTSLYVLVGWPLGSLDTQTKPDHH